MGQTAPYAAEEVDAYEAGTDASFEADMDAIHILPLRIVPLKAASLKRARLIKNVRLESVLELYSDTGGASGQLDPALLADTFDLPKNGQHPDERMIVALSELHSFDVYTLRIQLRKLGIRVDGAAQLRLSDRKCAELMSYMNVFTLPLLRQVYGSDRLDADNMNALVRKFSSPDKQEALRNLKMIADKLHIKLDDVPTFLEEYADIYLSISYAKDILKGLLPQITAFEDTMEEMQNNYELSKDARLMRSIEFIKDSFTDVTASVVSRFENFDRASEEMWNDITAESFNRTKKMIRGDHVATGAVLCGLAVKMSGWEANVAKGRGLVRLADFVRSDMTQGMEKIVGIENHLRQNRVGPGWESFKLENA